MKSWSGEERKKTRKVKSDEKKRKESHSRESGAGVGAKRVNDSLSPEVGLITTQPLLLL